MASPWQDDVTRYATLLMTVAVEATKDDVADNAPEDTGLLMFSIENTLPRRGGGGRIQAEIEQNESIAEYGKFLDTGTGIFGPRGRPVKSSSGKKMVFNGHRDGKLLSLFQHNGQGMHRGWFTRFPFSNFFHANLVQAQVTVR